jgi:hypothetical protein
MDPILSSYLEEMESEAMELVNRSDLVELFPQGPRPTQHFVVRYNCKGLVDTAEGVVETTRMDIGVSFPLDYWERADPGRVITLLGPPNVFHPNVLYPFLCPGYLNPGTTLTEIIMQCFEIYTYQKYNVLEHDALNRKACAWARRNVDRFPIDDRPITGRRIRLNIADAGGPEAAGETTTEDE